MEEKVNTTKIIINASDELTDIVRSIHKSKAERIILTFTEQTDLLISPINLRVLQEAAEREKKLLIAQIIQNPTGIRNSKLAGIKAIDTPASPVESDWEEASELIQSKEKVRKEKKVVKEDVEVKEGKNVSFENKVNDSLAKEKEKPKYIDKRGIKSTQSFISIDKDIPEDIAIENTQLKKVSNTRPVTNPKIHLRGSRIKNILTNIKGLSKKKLLKLGLYIFAPFLFLLLIGFLLFNQFGTLAKVKIYVESKPVEIESVLTGDKNTEEIDFENLKIPIKTEEETKSLSDSINATGKAYKGEKATGSIIITYMLGEGCPIESPKLVLQPGHTVSTSEYSYKLVSGVELEPCNDISDPVQVIAVDIGDQYNILGGKFFTVQGQPSSQAYALNSNAFTGGTKEEYTVLSQQDVDYAVEQLSTTAIEEVKSALRNVTGGWEIIEDTIRSEVDKSSIKTDKSVGVEATTVNLDLSIKGTATYYQTDGLNEILKDFLRTKAEEDNLFESDRDLELVLGDEIETEVTIEEIKGDIVKIKIFAKSIIKPKIDKIEIENTLRGMKWEEGKSYVDTLKFAERNADFEFQPVWYPDFLKKFPNRRGRVIVIIVELEVPE